MDYFTALQRQTGLNFTTDELSRPAVPARTLPENLQQTDALPPAFPLPEVLTDGWEDNREVDVSDDRRDAPPPDEVHRTTTIAQRDNGRNTHHPQAPLALSAVPPPAVDPAPRPPALRPPPPPGHSAVEQTQAGTALPRARETSAPNQGKARSAENRPPPHEHRPGHRTQPSPSPRLGPRATAATARPLPPATVRETPNNRNTGHRPMLQAVSQQVRAWVAEEPALTTAEQRTGVATRIIKQADQSLRNRREEVSMPPQAGPGPGRHPSAQGGAEYHVHLAIGPVSVNMTSTAPRTRKVETGADTPARGQGPDAASRLRRRYLLC